MAPKKAYNADSITVLEGLEAVRKRPGMYIGSTSRKGLNHLVYEIVDNSVDEHLAGYCSQITVTLNEDGSATVSDNGRGIPVGMHKQGVSAERVVFTTLHAGGKFDEGAYRTSGGLHGVGSSVVNALSAWMDVQVRLEGKIYHDRYKKGKPDLKLENGLLPVIGKTRETGTTISFLPDESIFTQTTRFSSGDIQNRLHETAYLNPDLLYRRTAEMLDGGDYHGSLFMTPEKLLAEVTKTELMNSFGLISSYTTSTTSNKNRNTNISLSAQAINGTTVLPGETFSFNAATGERTAEKGYKPATAISGGATRDEIGGGVCQTSSTLFNAVARANLEIVDRSPHAWPSSYVEKGFDATVNWPDLDFKFKNNTDWPIFIIAAYANQKVSASVYGMSLGVDTSIDLESITTRTLPQPEGTNYVINTALNVGESKKTVTGRKGYVVETWKVWYQGKREVRRELLFTSTYKAYQETIEYNPFSN